MSGETVSGEFPVRAVRKGNALTTENRVIFMRRYWFSDSYKDIAEFMGLSEKNISVRLTRIREKMKQYLIEREGIEQLCERKCGC